MVTRLRKSRTDRVIEGVCGGLAEYFGVDSTFVRLAFVLLIFLNGFGILLYIILLIIMPEADKADLTPKQAIQENVQGIGERLKETGEEMEKRLQEDKPERAIWLGGILILLGLYFLLDQIHFFWWLKSDVLLSLVLILLGAWLLISRARGRK